MIGTLAGPEPRTTSEAPSGNRPDDGDCVVCSDDADGIDARTRQPVCRKCATLRADGGRVEEHLHVAVDSYGNPVHLYRNLDDAEAAVESDDYAYSHVAGVWPDVPLISTSADDDVDRGDGVETDGGVTVYDCSECGEIEKCNVDDAGQRRCPDCGRAVTAVVTDGGRELYTCDTPTCDGEKEVTTPDGYVCRDCADELALQYEEVARGERAATDGGGGGRYHVVCPDCPFEALTRHRHRAADAVDAHGRIEPSHDARFEEVAGR
jgi:hypothetical protein